MSIRFIKAGLQTSIQDLGRFDLADKGISQNGAMDPIAMQTANWLVGMPLNSPVIEIALIGPAIEFICPINFAVCGAQFELKLNNQPVKNDQTIQAKAGDILSFGKLLSGARSYLAFSGTMKLEKVMDSYSTHLMAQFGGFKGRCFTDGDQLDFVEINNTSSKQLPEEFKLHYSGNYQLRITDSVESKDFSQKHIDQFLKQTYNVLPQSNRMGIRLQTGQPIQMNKSIISSGLTQGSIQIPPSGQPIISSVDGQTIGGYPRIANIISADLAILGQLKPNDKINFMYVSIQQALDIKREKMQRYQQLWDS